MNVGGKTIQTEVPPCLAGLQALAKKRSVVAAVPDELAAAAEAAAAEELAAEDELAAADEAAAADALAAEDGARSWRSVDYTAQRPRID